MRTITPCRLLVGLLTLNAVTTAALAADQFAQVSDPGWTYIEPVPKAEGQYRGAFLGFGSEHSEGILRKAVNFAFMMV